MPEGYWCPVLHAHLPYVRHPEYPEFLEEDWFYEALTETYVPLVSVLGASRLDGEVTLHLSGADLVSVEANGLRETGPTTAPPPQRPRRPPSGRTAWRTFRYITLPMLRPVIVVCVVIRAIDAFRTFDVVWTISSGGPARATEVFSIYAYVEAFQFLNFGRGSAAAVVGAVIIVVFAMLLYRVLNRWVEVSR